jgi:hypothetical protein
MLVVSAGLAVVILAGCKKDAPPAAPPPAVTAPEAPAAAKVAGPDKLKAEGKGYLVEVAPAAEAQAGQAGNVVITLKATEGFHLNKEYPLALQVTPGSGVSLAKDKLTIDDASKYEEKEGSWTVVQTAAAPGAVQTTALFKFAVCTESTCDPQRVELAWTVPVK